MSNNKSDPKSPGEYGICPHCNKKKLRIIDQAGDGEITSIRLYCDACEWDEVLEFAGTKKIKFSHADYEKFRRIDQKPPFIARLLQVFIIDYKDLSGHFKVYDTTYYVEQETKYYNLPKRQLLVLLFEEKVTNLLFTTIRTANPEKLEYYERAQGDDFLVLAG